MWYYLKRQMSNNDGRLIYEHVCEIETNWDLNIRIVYNDE